MEVNVTYTTPQETLAAMTMAAALAKKLDAVINFLAVQPVPYQLWTRQTAGAHRIPGEAVSRGRVQGANRTHVRIFLCRDRLQALREALKPHPLVW
jgi:hypothetical protein